MSRFQKAESDLHLWRVHRDALLRDREITPELASAVRAVDAAFKGEVLEFRIRAAVNSQALNEAGVSHVQPHETTTGQHRWDFDWWLTEASLRGLHAGIDALAQLLNLLFALDQDPDDRSLPSQVGAALKSRCELAEVLTTVETMWQSPECQDLAAFVNHVKHAGFPERHSSDVRDGLHRATTVEQFVYEGRSCGPWTPSDIETIIDGFRRHAVAVVEAASRAAG
jgi:hypothetical protein